MAPILLKTMKLRSQLEGYQKFQFLKGYVNMGITFLNLNLGTLLESGRKKIPPNLGFNSKYNIQITKEMDNPCR
jgi:hypothetical protein